MNFSDVITAVGTGPKGNRELNQEEITFVINSILDRKFTDAQIGAFLISWRAKYESNDELKYSLLALLNRVKKINEYPESVEIGYPADGKNRNPYLFLLACQFLKEHKDLKLSISYDDSAPVKFGYTLKDLISKVEIPQNVILTDRKEYLKELSDLLDLRKEISMRTVFNTIEKLTNPNSSKYALIGLHHSPYVEKYKYLYEGVYERLVVVKGDEGGPEISKNTKIVILDKDKEAIEERVELKEYNIEGVDSKDELSLEEYIKRSNNPTIELKNIAKINAALILLASKKANTLKEAYSKL